MKMFKVDKWEKRRKKKRGDNKRNCFMFDRTKDAYDWKKKRI